MAATVLWLYVSSSVHEIPRQNLQYAAGETDQNDDFTSTAHLQGAKDPKWNSNQSKIGKDIHNVEKGPERNEIDTFAVDKIPCIWKSASERKNKHRRKRP